MLKINTHNAYLNTEIIITNASGDIVNLVDLSTSDEYELKDTLKLHLSAGPHHFFCKDLNEEFTVYIEDAIKLGGGSIKNNASFVSDKSPWIFVTMKDRLYGHNLDTQEEFIEYSLTPNKIDLLGDDYFLFQTDNDYTVFYMQSRKAVFHCTNIVYSNHNFVIYNNNTDDGVFNVYNYREDSTEFSFNGQYSIAQNDAGDDLLFYISDLYIHSFNLKTRKDEIINEIPDGIGRMYIHRHIAYDNGPFCLYKKWFIIDNYFFDLVKKMLCGSITLPEKCEIIDILGRKAKTDCKEQIDSFRKEAYDIIEKYPCISHTHSCVSINDICEKCGKIEVLYTMVTYNIFLRYIKPVRRYFITILNDNPSEINYKEFNRKIQIDSQNQETSSLESMDGESLLALSSSKDRYLTMSRNEIHFHEKGECITILKELYDSTKYRNAYFISNGDAVVLKDEGGNLSSLGLTSFLEDNFDIEGITSFKKDAYNGYKPEICFNNTGSMKPVWRDPISLSIIDPDEIAGLEYVSPDNVWRAESKVHAVYFNRLTEENINSDEYLSLRKEYYLWSGIPDKEKSIIIDRRRKLYRSKRTAVESLLRESKADIIKDSKGLNEWINEEIERCIVNMQDFSSLFIETQGYFICRNQKDSRIRKILIGRNVWFLNYVSFSYDSRYLAFGAKMYSDEIRLNQEGVFEIYDLFEDKVVYRMGQKEQLHAVWMTLFSKLGDVAFYESQPNAYIVKASSNYKEASKISGKSLLCFSPFGNYIACSDQRYISYRSCPQGSWGHQPSGNIYIYSVDDLHKELVRFNDFGEGLKGAAKSSRRDNVAAAAFSQDEKRLLAIDEDGVVVVRNLNI